MDLPAKIEFLKSALASQRTTLRIQTALAGLLFALGIGVVVLGILNPGLVLSESLKGGQTLGGAVVTASGFVPLRFSRRESVRALSLLVTQYQLQQRKRQDVEEIRKLDQYFDHYFAKALGG